MTAQFTTSDLLNPEQIRQFLSATGPCVTIVLPEKEIPDAMNQVRRKLGERDVDAGALLDSAAEEWRKASEDNKGRNPIAILRSADLLRVLPVNPAIAATVQVSDRFDLRTLLDIFSSDSLFYLLALSQRRARLIECTRHSSREIPFPPGIASSLSDANQNDQPERNLYEATTDRENKDANLLNLFSGIDKAVHAALKGKSEPLVVAGVENELALYRKVNTYPHVVEPGIHGAPDGIEGAELHRRALELLDAQPPAKLADFDKKVGTGHASVHIQEIVVAAYEGRVSDLFFQENARYEGTFDAVRQRVKHSNDPLDNPGNLVEDAAFQTIMHSGVARTLPASAMPNGVPVCALFRYPAARVSETQPNGNGENQTQEAA